MDNTAGSVHANRQVSLQNRKTFFVKSICQRCLSQALLPLICRFTLFFLYALSSFFYAAASLFGLSANEFDSFLLIFLFFNGAAVFLFSMFFMFIYV